MDLRQMRAFVALADNLHFGRAAESLGVSQPALSQLLSKLEAEMGAELVVRTSREVSLSPVGELFLEGCRRTLSEALRAEEIVRDAPLGINAHLVIGTLGAGANGPLPEMISGFRATTQGLVVELHHHSNSATLEREILAGSLDLGVVRSISNEQLVASRRLLDEQFVVYLPDSHPLAARERVRLHELAAEDFILWPRYHGPSYYDLIISGCQRAGFTPRITGYGTSLESQLALVAAGIGVTLQAESNSSIIRAGVRCIPLAADLDATLWLAYRRWHRPPIVDRFLADSPTVEQRIRQWGSHASTQGAGL
ncbi:LysR substrate-binding domain-containing protein [Microbacterium sp. AK031]|uniref:LysR substrate-binding domain-containing protein n=1 Tax=Microbacterium sp. AK031 TaxID=2723076 RepID=UPI002168FA79|nr:LysR substrate-binding domain-containing protein [Microbacterium sp. AK031]MCS3843829.1 DNA-binding transcriptional LysR family regulator [Microbacterium sp. AK031]